MPEPGSGHRPHRRDSICILTDALSDGTLCLGSHHAVVAEVSAAVPGPLSTGGRRRRA
jgi:hypothetical protein